MCTRNNLSVLDSVFRLSKCSPCFAFFVNKQPIDGSCRLFGDAADLESKGGAVVEQQQNLGPFLKTFVHISTRNGRSNENLIDYIQQPALATKRGKKGENSLPVLPPFFT
jgi:hypothetical protein